MLECSRVSLQNVLIVDDLSLMFVFFLQRVSKDVKEPTFEAGMKIRSQERKGSTGIFSSLLSVKLRSNDDSGWACELHMSIHNLICREERERSFWAVSTSLQLRLQPSWANAVCLSDSRCCFGQSAWRLSCQGLAWDASLFLSISRPPAISLASSIPSTSPTAPAAAAAAAPSVGRPALLP